MAFGLAVKDFGAKLFAEITTGATPPVCTAEHKWLTKPVWLAPQQTTLPTPRITLHITTLLIGIVWELYGTSNPINDRVMHLEPIKTEYNLT